MKGKPQYKEKHDNKNNKNSVLRKKKSTGSLTDGGCNLLHLIRPIPFFPDKICHGQGKQQGKNAGQWN